MIQSRMSSASTPTPTAVARPAGRYAVYVAAVPLRAPQGPAQALMSSAYSLGLWDLQHFMVLLRPDPARTRTQEQEPEPSLVFDFQPLDPEDALAAFSVLSRSKIPGVVRRRTLRRIPDRRSWFVGLSDGGAADAAERFSERWPTDLVVGNHDCRDYTNGWQPQLPLYLHNIAAISSFHHLNLFFLCVCARMISFARAGGSLDRTKTRPRLAEISRPPMRPRHRGVGRTAFFYLSFFLLH
uniref:Uncharacterized protein n=1 Tax=Triticum urartu TaxID=4572 RepID=A0A8R7US69_TRIUA